MIGLGFGAKILLFCRPTDMRKGFDGLSALVLAAGHDLYSGQLYVFVSRRRDRAKVLVFDRGGFVIWYKRLERGCFRPIHHAGTDQVALDATALSMLLDGIDVAKVKRPRLWQPRNTCERIDSAAHL